MHTDTANRFLYQRIRSNQFGHSATFAKPTIAFPSPPLQGLVCVCLCLADQIQYFLNSAKRYVIDLRIDIRFCQMRTTSAMAVNSFCVGRHTRWTDCVTKWYRKFHSLSVPMIAICPRCGIASRSRASDGQPVPPSEWSEFFFAFSIVFEWFLIFVLLFRVHLIFLPLIKSISLFRLVSPQVKRNEWGGSAK